MDDHDSRGYAFDNDRVKESFGIDEAELALPLPSDLEAFGKEPV
jgi:hypothetical protein